jgi:hypothetical protein
VVEYALRNLKRPIGVAQWETSIVKALPKEFKGILPTVEEIEAELAAQIEIQLQSRHRTSWTNDLEINSLTALIDFMRQYAAYFYQINLSSLWVVTPFFCSASRLPPLRLRRAEGDLQKPGVS